MSLADEPVTLVPDQRLPGDLPDRLIRRHDLYKKATDVALFYYVGHGQIDDEGQLCLGLVDSRRPGDRTPRDHQPDLRCRPQGTAHQPGLHKSDHPGLLLRRTSRPRAPDPGRAGGRCFRLTSGTGAYILAATGPYSTAWFESDQDTPIPHTYFTKRSDEIVERGIRSEPAGLTLDPIYRRLREDLPAAGKPAPPEAAATTPTPSCSPAMPHPGRRNLRHPPTPRLTETPRTGTGSSTTPNAQPAPSTAHGGRHWP